MGLAQAVRVLLTILSTVVVARILSPDDYGIIAMVAPVTALVMMVQNLGLGHAAVQAQSLSHEQSNALFWLNMAGSLVVGAVLVAGAPAVSWFYGDPRAGYVTTASALTVILTALTLQHSALLAREMRFRAIGLIDVAAALATFVATVAAALWLRNYWALWLGTLLGVVCNVVLLWFASGWRPSLRIRLRGSGQLIRFGGSITVFGLLSIINRNLDNVLIGRVWGPGPLGLYDRSYRLMMFPLQNVNAPLSRVILPILGRLRSEPDRYRRSFLYALHLISFALIPGIAVAGAASERLVPFLLGWRWADAAPIFEWLSLGGLLLPLGNMTSWLFISTGRGKALMSWGAVATTTTVAAFAIGVFWGPVGVAAALFAVSALRLPLLIWWCVQETPVRARDLYVVAFAGAAIAAAAWGCVGLVSESLSFPATMTIALVAAYALAFLCHWLIPDGRAALRYGYGEARRLVPRRARR